MSPNSLPLQNKCEVLDFHPKGIWAINKSIGVLSHPNKKEEQKNSLLKCTYDLEKECYHWIDGSGIQQKLFLIHRLDSATSGVLLAATAEDLALELKNAFAQRLVHKTYHAIVEYRGGDIPPLWKDNLIKKTSQGQIRVVKNKSGQPAVTQVSIERRNRNSQYSLVRSPSSAKKTGSSFTPLKSVWRLRPSREIKSRGMWNPHYPGVSGG
ncbi:MAG: hypothetical protein EBY48_08355 [Opitutae bacterium]|nr:hypothetical protein [Opitutae bacterium]